MNAETEDSELMRNVSAYSSYKEHHIVVNEEERFKHFIQTQFPTDAKEIDKFAELFIIRGMKSKTRGFIKLTDAVKEGLVGREEQFQSFLMILELKIFEFIKMLPSNKIYESSKEKDKTLRLILMAAEMFNLGLMKDNLIVMCLDKLLDDIGSDQFQITLFHLLIKTILDKMIANGMENLCKSFLDKLSRRVETLNNSEDRNLLSWEIFVTMKVLLFRTQQAIFNCPVKYFKTILMDLNDKNFSDKINEFKSRVTFKSAEIIEIVEIYMVVSSGAYNTAIFVALGEELQNMKASDIPDFTFKKYLESKAHNDIKNYLNETSNNQKMLELVKWTSFIGELYVQTNVASIYLILCVLEMLLEKEVLNKKIVECINILLRKVGFKIDGESILLLDKFFLYFDHIAKNENSYRSSVYKNLIELRFNKWKVVEGEKEMELIKELLAKLNENNLMQISLIFCGLVCKSAEIFNIFNKLLWKFILMNPEMILKYAKLANAISTTYQKFRSSFMTFLNQRNDTFNKLMLQGKEGFTDSVRNKLGTVILFVGYLYALNFATENELSLWMLPNFTNHLSMEESTELSIIVGSKINESDNNELKGFLGIVEFNTRQNMLATLKSVKSDLAELLET